MFRPARAPSQCEIKAFRPNSPGSGGEPRIYEAKAAGDRQRLLKLLCELTVGYIAGRDMPNIDFIPELMDIYHQAKSVLVTREPGKWWISFAATLSYCEL